MINEGQYQSNCPGSPRFHQNGPLLRLNRWPPQRHGWISLPFQDGTRTNCPKPAIRHQPSLRDLQRGERMPSRESRTCTWGVRAKSVTLHLSIAAFGFVNGTLPNGAAFCALLLASISKQYRVGFLGGTFGGISNRSSRSERWLMLPCQACASTCGMLPIFLCGSD